MKQTIVHKNMKKSKQTHYEWIFYAMSFLGLAKIGCRELIDQKYRDGNPLMENSLYGTEKFLLIPILFNFKHALELFIKGAGVSIDGNYWNKHDLDYLLKDLEPRVKNLFKNRGENKVFQKIEELKLIIKKYIRFEDYKNVLYRYPNSKIENFDTIKVEKILHDIKKTHGLFVSIRGKVNSTRLGLPDPGSWS